MPRRTPRDRQPGLFDALGMPEPATSAPRAVGPAAFDAATARLAADLPAGIHLGTSSWSFPGWAGIVYDRKASESKLAREGLAAYARHPLLRCVGVDRTFYAPVGADVFAAYAAQVPVAFRFVVKAASAVTSPVERDAEGRRGEPNPLFLDAAWTRDHVVAPFVEGLGEKGAGLVFQFPPLGGAIVGERERFAERLAGFLAALPRGVVYAVELRDRPLVGDAYVSALRETGVAHCVSVHPRMPSAAEQLEVARAAGDGPLFVRWMLGVGLGYDEAKDRYQPFDRLVDEDPQTREALAAGLLDWASPSRPGFVVANNKAEGSAPLTLAKLAAAVLAQRRSAQAPPAS